MILATRDGNHEVRGVHGFHLDFAGTDRIPHPSEAGATHAGRRVTLATAVGIPAFLRGVRLISETVGSMPLRVVRDEGDNRADPITDAWQWPLLMRQPIPDMPIAATHVWRFAIVCMMRGGVVLQKLKARGQLLGLEPIAPDRYGGRPRMKDGELIVEIRDVGRKPVTLTREDMIYVPGILLDHPFIGVSVIEAMRQALGNPIARQAFEGQYLANDGGITTVLKHADEKTPRQRAEIRRGFMRGHTRPGVPAVMWGGWELDKMELSLADAQFVESQQFTVGDVGRMLGIPGRKLGDPNAPDTDGEREDQDFLQYGLLSWMQGLEQGLHLDDDLFPDKDAKPAFFTGGLIRASMKVRYESYLRARQAGWMEANEIRAEEGKPAHPDGSGLQATPVGGAPNPPGDPGGHPDETEE